MNSQTAKSACTRHSENLPANFIMKSTLNHVALIMDGNRRWAKMHKLANAEGHRKGLDQLIKLLPYFRKYGLQTVSVFGFASANWKRKPSEVANIMQLADQALRKFTPLCIREGLCVKLVGRRDRLPRALLHSINIAERSTAHGECTLRIALDYSSRNAILSAAKVATSSNELSHILSSNSDVDLLIRTGKEQRLSDFLLWECAFAELYFPPVYWPDFNVQMLVKAINWYRSRDRRFGV